MQKTHSSGPARACDPTLDMAITGLMAALVFTGTYFFKIPTAFGYTPVSYTHLTLPTTERV